MTTAARSRNATPAKSNKPAAKKKAAPKKAAKKKIADQAVTSLELTDKTATPKTATKKAATKKAVSKPAVNKQVARQETAPKKAASKKVTSKQSSSQAPDAPALKEWYDYPEYYDLFFQEETPREVKFLQAAFERFGSGPIKRIIEPACGSGRLVFELAKKGYEVAGFDLNENALEFLRKRLAKRKLTANVYKANMVDFTVDQPYDVALNTFNTFRHLLTEEDAVAHLRAVAAALRPQGLFFLGLHVMPPDADDHCIERWKGKTGKSEVSFTLRVVQWNQRLRQETLRVSMLIREGDKKPVRVQNDMQLRSYTLPQLKRVLAQVPELEVVQTFDFWLEIDEPIELNRDTCDLLLVLRKVAN